MPTAFPDILPVGSVIHSMLTEAQFQAETSSGWILADGRSVVGSRYAAITGATTSPNAQGRFLRARDAAGTTDPDGTVALGTLKADQNQAHSHTLSESSVGGGSQTFFSTIGTLVTGTTFSAANTAQTNTNIGSSGSTDGRPLNIIMNCFIRIN